MHSQLHGVLLLPLFLDGHSKIQKTQQEFRFSWGSRVHLDKFGKVFFECTGHLGTLHNKDGQLQSCGILALVL